MPTGRLGSRGHHSLHMSQKIGLAASGSTTWGDDLATHHIPTQDEGTGAMTHVLKFASLHLAWSQRQPGVFALQRLHSSQFIRTHYSFSLLGQRRGLFIQLTSCHDGRSEEHTSE